MTLLYARSKGEGVYSQYVLSNYLSQMLNILTQYFMAYLIMGYIFVPIERQLPVK